MSKGYYAVDSGPNKRHGQFINVDNALANLPESQKQSLFRGEERSYVVLPKANVIGTEFSLSAFVQFKSGMAILEPEEIFSQPSSDGLRVSLTVSEGTFILTSGTTKSSGTTQVEYDKTYHLFMVVTSSKTTLLVDGREEIVWEYVLPDPGTFPCSMGSNFYGTIDEVAVLPVTSDYLDSSHYLNFVANRLDPKRVHYATFSPELSSVSVVISDRTASSNTPTYSTAISSTTVKDGTNWECKVGYGVESSVGVCTSDFDPDFEPLGMQNESLGYFQDGRIVWTNELGEATETSSTSYGVGDHVRFSTVGTDIEIYLNDSKVFSQTLSTGKDWLPATSIKSGSVELNSGQAHFYGQQVLEGLVAKTDTSLTSESHYQKSGKTLPLYETSGTSAKDTAGTDSGTYSGSVLFGQPSVTKDPTDLSISLGETGSVEVPYSGISSYFTVSLCFSATGGDTSGTVCILSCPWLKVELVSGSIKVSSGASTIFQEVRKVAPGFSYSITLINKSGNFKAICGSEVLFEGSTSLAPTDGSFFLGTDTDKSNRMKGRLSHFMWSTSAVADWKLNRIYKFMPASVLLFPTEEKLVKELYTLPVSESVDFTLSDAFESVAKELYTMPASDSANISIGAP
ncbi:hypothetical protein [Endozoicomonas sp. ALC066]|uniref:hypothetical protein n=1 Tax=Endozoicomonas sp. ALC066 TaxID=3403078 RepID=UPI003BB72C99